MLINFRRQTISGPVADLESEISTILSSLPGAIDNAIDVEQAAIRFRVFKRQSQGNVQLKPYGNYTIKIIITFIQCAFMMCL